MRGICVIAIIQLALTRIQSEAYVSKKLLESLVITEREVETYCIDEWEYLFVNSGFTWDQAKLDCESRNMTLAVVNKNLTAYFLAAALSEFTLEIEDMWIGGKQTQNKWTWEATGEKIPTKYKEEDIFPQTTFPFWVERPKKIALTISPQCLALDRKNHDQPIFVTLPCEIKRSYICQRAIQEPTEPVLIDVLKINGTTFYIVGAKSTWDEAVSACIEYGMKLARVDNLGTLEILAQHMMRSRPIMERAWLGAKYSQLEANWLWMSPTDVLDQDRLNQSSYPPWSEKPPKQDGCLLLDRHLCKNPMFLAAKCTRRRNFICSGGNSTSVTERPEPPFGNLQLFTTPQTWQRARSKCHDLGARLLTLTTPTDNMEFIKNLTKVLTEGQIEIKHIWLGAQYDAKQLQWYWVDTKPSDERVYIDHTTFTIGDTKFCYEAIGMENREDMACLNLDRENHNHMQLYGMPCNTTQQYICYIATKATNKE